MGPLFATYRERNSATTPDMIFTNDKAIHNIQIEPGPFTTSDHLPIRCKITTKPITITTTPTYNTAKANWEIFNNITENKTANININENMSSETLEQ